MYSVDVGNFVVLVIVAGCPYTETVTFGQSHYPTVVVPLYDRARKNRWNIAMLVDRMTAECCQRTACAALVGFASVPRLSTSAFRIDFVTEKHFHGYQCRQYHKMMMTSKRDRLETFGAEVAVVAAGMNCHH